MQAPKTTILSPLIPLLLFLLFFYSPSHAQTQEICTVSCLFDHVTDGNQITDMAKQGDELWVATTGGLIHWDLTNNHYQKYTTKHGLPSNHVAKVTIDDEGKVWMLVYGGKAGLASFDGECFEQYDFVGGCCTYALTFDSTGKLLIGTWERLLIYDVTTGELKEDESLKGIKTIEKGAGEDLWMVGAQSLNEGFLYQYQNGEIELITAFKNPFFWPQIAADQLGNIWFSSQYALHQYSATTQDTLPSQLFPAVISGLTVDADNALWVGHTGTQFTGDDFQNIIYRFSDKDTTLFQTMNGLPADRNNCNRLFFSDGAIWLGTDAGWAKMEATESTFSSYQTEDGLRGNEPQFFTFDQAGNLWLSEKSGLKFKAEGSNEFETIVLDSNFPHLAIQYIHESASNFWVATQNGLYVREETGTFQQIGTEKPLTQISAMQSLGNDLYLGNGKELLLYKEGIVSTLASYDYDINDMTVDEEGKLWVGVGDGAANGALWSFVEGESVLENESLAVKSLLFEADTLWLGTTNGPLSDLWFYTANQGFESTSFNIPVVDLARNQEGKLWISTAGQGIWGFPSMENYTVEDGLPVNITNNLAIDANNQLWIGTLNGLGIMNNGGNSEISLEVPSSLPLCNGQVLLTANEGFEQYEWRLGETLVGTEASFEAMTEGEYILTVYDACNSAQTATVEVIEGLELIPMIDFSSEQDSAQLSLENLPENANVLWSTGEEGMVVDVTVGGDYWADVSYNDCTQRVSFVVNLVSTSFEEIIPVAGLNYSNPVKNKIILLLENTSLNPKLKLYNLQGELVSTGSGTELSVAHLPVGIYLLEVGLGEESMVLKVVKE